MIGSTLGESLAMTNDNSFVKKRKHVPFLQINRVHAWKSWTSAFRVKAINSLSPLIFFLKWNKIANNMNIIWVRLSDDSFFFFFHFSFFFGLVSVILFKIYIYIFFVSGYVASVIRYHLWLFTIKFHWALMYSFLFRIYT